LTKFFVKFMGIILTTIWQLLILIRLLLQSHRMKFKMLIEVIIMASCSILQRFHRITRHVINYSVMTNLTFNFQNGGRYVEWE